MGNNLMLHSIAAYGPGTVNAGKDGQQKIIDFGGSLRAYISAQKIKAAFRSLLKDSGLPYGIQTRKMQKLLSDSIIDLIENGTVTKEDAKKISEDVIIGYLGRESKENDDETVDDEKKEENKKIEGTKYTPEEVEMLKDAVRKLAIDKKLTVKDINLLPIGKAVDIVLSGRMRPKKEIGAVKFSYAISTNKVDIGKKDYFRAIDDLGGDTLHIGEKTIATFIPYFYVEIDLDLVVKLLKDKDTVKKVLRILVDMMTLSLPRSESSSGGAASVSSSYVMAEYSNKTTRNFLCAFNKPVETLEDAIAALENTQRTMNNIYNYTTETKVLDCIKGNGSINDLMIFIESKVDGIKVD